MKAIVFNEELLKRLTGSDKVKVLTEKRHNELLEKIDKLEKKLEIATKGLKSIKHKIDDFEDDPMNKIEFMAYGNLWSVRDVSKKALKKIEELDK